MSMFRSSPCIAHNGDRYASAFTAYVSLRNTNNIIGFGLLATTSALTVATRLPEMT